MLVIFTKRFIELVLQWKNMSRFFTIRGCIPVELDCLRNVCTPLNLMFYCLDLDYRRGLFWHDLSDVPSRVFVLFPLSSLFFFHQRKVHPHGWGPRQKILLYEVKCLMKTEMWQIKLVSHNSTILPSSNFYLDT